MLNTNIHLVQLLFFLFGMYPFILHFGCFILYDLRPFSAVLMAAVVEAGKGTPSIQRAINSLPKSSPASGHKKYVKQFICGLFTGVLT